MRWVCGVKDKPGRLIPALIGRLRRNHGDGRELVVDQSKMTLLVCVVLAWYGVVSVPPGPEARSREGEQELRN